MIEEKKVVGSSDLLAVTAIVLYWKSKPKLKLRIIKLQLYELRRTSDAFDGVIKVACSLRLCATIEIRVFGMTDGRKRMYMMKW